MTNTFTFEPINVVKLRTLVRINDKPFSFLTENVSIDGDQITLNDTDAALVAKAAKNAEKAAKARARRDRKATARRRAPVAPMTAAEFIIGNSSFRRMDSQMTEKQASYLASLVRKSGDSLDTFQERTGMSHSQPITRGDASRAIEMYAS